MRHPIDGVTPVPAEEAARYFENGAWLRLTIGDALRDAARRAPDKTAIVTPSRRIGFAELDRRSESLAAALLELGLRPMDRAIFQMGSDIETVVVLFACFKAGIVPVCALPQHRELEIGTLANLSEAKAHFVQADAAASFDLVAFAADIAGRYPSLGHILVTNGEPPVNGHGVDALVARWPYETAVAAVADAVRLDPDDVAVFQLSGGTTGVPKIIPRFHGEYLGYGVAWADLYGFGPDDVTLWALPLIHNAAMLLFLMPAIVHAHTLVLMPRFEARAFLETVEREGVTGTGSIGPVAAKLLDFADVASVDLSRLRSFITLNRADAIEAHLGVPTGNMFGMTEGLLLGSPPDAPALARFTTTGRPASPHDEVRVLEIGGTREVPLGSLGELAFRGPSSLRGYFRAPEATRAALTPDGFVRTGDLVKAHRIEGTLYYSFEGRIKDNIDRGGEKFGAEEVELLIAQHPAVSEVAVVAMPDRVYGEKACAYIIPRPGQAAPDVGALGGFLLSKNIAKYKLPERVEEVDSFPVTRVGKIDKPMLRRMIAEKMAAEAEEPAEALRA